MGKLQQNQIVGLEDNFERLEEKLNDIATGNSLKPNGAFSNNLGEWNAETNNLEIVSSNFKEADGDFATVSTAGTIAIDGNDIWEVDDIIWWNSLTNKWEKIDNQTATQGNISKLKKTITLDNIIHFFQHETQNTFTGEQIAIEIQNNTPETKTINRIALWANDVFYFNMDIYVSTNLIHHGVYQCTQNISTSYFNVPAFILKTNETLKIKLSATDGVITLLGIEMPDDYQPYYKIIGTNPHFNTVELTKKGLSFEIPKIKNLNNLPEIEEGKFLLFNNNGILCKKDSNNNIAVCELTQELINKLEKTITLENGNTDYPDLNSLAYELGFNFQNLETDQALIWDGNKFKNVNTVVALFPELYDGNVLTQESNWDNNISTKVKEDGTTIIIESQSGSTYIAMKFADAFWVRFFVDPEIKTETTLGQTIVNKLLTSDNWKTTQANIGVGAKDETYTDGDIRYTCLKDGIWVKEYLGIHDEIHINTDLLPTASPFVAKNNSIYFIPEGHKITHITAQTIGTEAGNFSIGTQQGNTNILENFVLPATDKTCKQLNINYPDELLSQTEKKELHFSLTGVNEINMHIITEKILI